MAIANIVRVYIVRHGETEANKTGIIQGHLDTKLNDEGIKQAEKVGNALKCAQLGIAFTSDLSRAVQVSLIIPMVGSLRLLTPVM
jgi:broad specificity phosphatase PhoE